MDDSEPSSSTAPQVPLRSRICSEGNDDDELVTIANRVRHSLNIEDSVFLLQKFEKNAFRAVVAAFRAQGPLTPYKELILEHLKFALFIKDHDYVTNIQEAADDPIIKNLCKTMNASYSSSDEWRKLGFTAHSRKGPVIRHALTSKNPSKPPDRTKLITKIGSHNVSVSELDLATAKLCNLRKERWVPQVLRRELYNTEAANGRIDIDPLDISETEFEHEMEVYEERRDRLENERFAADYDRMKKQHLRGKKLSAVEKRKKREKAPLPAFYDETLRAQARAAVSRDERVTNDDGVVVETLSDGITEEIQQRAEVNMLKFINDSLRAASASPVRQPLGPAQSAATTSKSAPNIISPPTSVISQPDSVPVAQSSVPPPPAAPPTVLTVTVPSSAPESSSTPVTHASTVVNLRQQFLSAVAEVKDAVYPSPKKRGKKKENNSNLLQKATSSRRGPLISDSQRDLDEALVLEKTAQAMIEDLENVATTSTATPSTATTSTATPMDVDPVPLRPAPSTPSTSTSSIASISATRLVSPEKSPVIHVVSPSKSTVSRPAENGVKRTATVTPLRAPPQRPLPKITPCEAPTAPVKRRGRRPAETSTVGGNQCARVQPFLFDEIRPDGSKPPRGNPDKRFCSALKRVNTYGQPPVHPKAMIAKPATNGVPSTAPTGSAQPSDAPPSRTPLPKSAIVPASAIVIRPRANSISSSSPGNPQATSPQVPVIEALPAKRMRYVSETNSNNASGSVTASPSTSAGSPSGSNTSIMNQSMSSVMTTSAGIPIVRHPSGRPTLFRPPNVVFPRASTALNNGNPRYVVPYSPQAGASPSRPYYSNTTFTPRARTSDRPFLLSLTRNPSPQTTVRFVSPSTGDSGKLISSSSNPELVSNGPLRTTTVRLPNGGPLHTRSIIAPFSKSASAVHGDGSASIRQSITIIRPELRHKVSFPVSVPVPAPKSISVPSYAAIVASAPSVPTPVADATSSTPTLMSSIDEIVTSIATATPIRPANPPVTVPQVSLPLPISSPSTTQPAVVSAPVSVPSSQSDERIDDVLDKTINSPSRQLIESAKKSSSMRAVSSSDSPASVFEFASTTSIRGHTEPIRINLKPRLSVTPSVTPTQPSPSVSLDEVLLTQAFFELPPPPPPPPDAATQPSSQSQSQPSQSNQLYNFALKQDQAASSIPLPSSPPSGSSESGGRQGVS